MRDRERERKRKTKTKTKTTKNMPSQASPSLKPSTSTCA
jgi:hypothetical protein